jgi:hypothetical protein
MNTNNLLTAAEIGMIIGLFLLICGLVAAIREQLLLTVIYATVMALITTLTLFNFQFIINLLTTIVAFIYALAIKLRSCRSIASSAPDPQHVIYHSPQSSAVRNQNEQLLSHPSAPTEPPPYYAPPPSYEETVK